MNTYNFNKSISSLFKLGFIALAILGLSLTAQAGSIEVSSSTHQVSSELIDLSDQQGEVLQSQQPSCGDDLQDGSVASTIGNDSLTPNTSWALHLLLCRQHRLLHRCRQ